VQVDRAFYWATPTGHQQAGPTIPCDAHAALQRGSFHLSSAWIPLPTNVHNATKHHQAERRRRPMEGPAAPVPSQGCAGATTSSSGDVRTGQRQPGRNTSVCAQPHTGAGILRTSSCARRCANCCEPTPHRRMMPERNSVCPGGGAAAVSTIPAGAPAAVGTLPTLLSGPVLLNHVRAHLLARPPPTPGTGGTRLTPEPTPDRVGRGAQAEQALAPWLKQAPPWLPQIRSAPPNEGEGGLDERRPEESASDWPYIQHRERK
jgi:hypothetical protein